MVRWSVGYILVHRSKVQIVNGPMSGELQLLIGYPLRIRT